MEQLLSIAENLCLNLCTEIIGILITVLIIDRLLKNREEKRWQQAKGAMYANILNSLVDTVRQLPDELRQTERPVVYYYGNSTVIVKFGLREHLTKDALSILEKEIRKPAGFDVNTFFITKQRIRETINSSAFLLDPTLTESVLIFDQQISLLKESIPDSTILHGKQESAAQILSLVIRSMANIHSWLIKQADKQITLDEHLKSILR